MVHIRRSRILLRRPSVSDLYHYLECPNVRSPANSKPFLEIFPNELLISILEFAAEISTSTLLALTMVSHAVQKMVDPVLFKDIHIGRKHESTRMLKKMVSDSCSPRFLRARGYIVTIRITWYDCYIGKALLHSLFMHCPNLNFLSPGIIHTNAWNWVPPSRLRVLTFGSSRGFDWEAVNFIGPLAQQITHISFGFILGEHLRLVPRFQNLTHLFLKYDKSIWDKAVIPWDILIPDAPQLELVLIHLYLPFTLWAPKTTQALSLQAAVGTSAGRFTQLIDRVSGPQEPEIDPRFVGVVDEIWQDRWEGKGKNFVVFLPQNTEFHVWLHCGWKQGETITQRLRRQISNHAI